MTAVYSASISITPSLRSSKITRVEHEARKTMTFSKEIKIYVLQWPFKFQNLNLIERVKDIMKRGLTYSISSIFSNFFLY